MPKLATPQVALDRFRDLLKQPLVIGQIRDALQHSMPFSRYLVVLVNLLKRNPKLLECHPYSLLGAVIQAAQLGLEIDPLLRMVAFVPFRNKKTGQIECQVIIQYPGLIELATCGETGIFSHFDAWPVFKGEHFSVELGTRPRIEHKPKYEIERTFDQLVACYAVGYLKAGGYKFEVTPRSRIDEIRKRALARGEGPWLHDTIPMAQKTGIRQLFRTVPLRGRLGKALELDELADANLSQGLAHVLDTDRLPKLEEAEAEPEQPSEPEK